MTDIKLKQECLRDLSTRLLELPGSSSLKVAVVFYARWDKRAQTIMGEDWDSIGAGSLANDLYVYFFAPKDIDQELLDKWRAIADILGDQLYDWHQGSFKALGPLKSWMRWTAAVIAYKQTRRTLADIKLRLDWSHGECELRKQCTCYLVFDLVAESIVVAKRLASVEHTVDYKSKQATPSAIKPPRDLTIVEKSEAYMEAMMNAGQPWPGFQKLVKGLIAGVGGGSRGTVTKILASNPDLKAWSENRSVSADKFAVITEKGADFEIMDDEEINPTLEKYLKNLPPAEREKGQAELKKHSQEDLRRIAKLLR